jgi:hypothetical protein
MNSKLRFLGDGMAGVYVKCYFSRLRSTSSALLGLLNPDVERETTHFGPNPPNHGYIIIARSPSSTTYKKAIDLPSNNGIFSDYCKRASKEAAVRTSTCFDGEWIYRFNRSSADGTSITIAGLSDWLSIARSPCKPVFWYKRAVSCEEFFRYLESCEEFFRYLDDENQKCDDCVVYTASFATG